MKFRILGILLIGLLLFSCNNGSDNEEVIYETIRDTASLSSEEDSALTIVHKPSLWVIDGTDAAAEKLKAPTDKNIESMSMQQITTEINQIYTEIPLNYIKTSHDTAFVNISSAMHLTNEIGSTGAYNYMAMVVYNLTENKEVKFVNFKFTEGDHAAPGVYSREDFKRLR